MKNQIVVYADKGVDGTALKHLIHSLKRELDPTMKIKRLDAQSVMEKNWEEDTQLFIMPGGRDVFYQSALAGKGTDKIRSYVEKKGNYLGICAGAYFACSRIEFEKGTSLELLDDRSLCFFPGVAIGPAYGTGKYAYDSFKGACSALVNWENGFLRVYFNGGCFFTESSEVRVLSRYLDLPQKPPAIVEMEHGEGKVLLSGVHFEYIPDLLDQKDPQLSFIHPELEKDNSSRKEMLCDLLKKMGCRLKTSF
ncbi:MAG: BPL-N domain-containing protein [Candidatus Rhabdochlamydia sp.]